MGDLKSMTNLTYSNPGTFVRADALQTLHKAPPADFAFLDPPYEDIELIYAAIATALNRRAWRMENEDGLKSAIACFMWLKDVPVVFHNSPFKPDTIIVWEKPQSTKNTSKDYSQFLEAICIWHGAFFNKDLHWANRTGIFVDRLVERPPFPHKKPDTLVERLIKLHTKPGGKVIDSFAGTGTVKDVCDRCGFLSLSSDLDPKGKLAKISLT